ncbi:MAG: membrane protein insertion efficiency factor YidD [Actinobacteria bacterium]|jgi:putative membrane protein insertion efficiency factor|nr:membrane protein insertion efficiency factor YidD [Actinomycetota bacterium]
MRKVFALVIRAYQFLSSPFAPSCKYYPSCSQYAITAISRHGVKGIAMAAWRILRCNPWSHGGVDYVDEYRDCADAVNKRTKELVGAN